MTTSNTYSVSGQFRNGTDVASFPRTREGLESAYKWIYDAAAWQIKCGSELVDEFDPWADERVEF